MPTRTRAAQPARAPASAPERSTSEAQYPVPQPIFFFNDTATTEIYTLSLHDALPISSRSPFEGSVNGREFQDDESCQLLLRRSEEHTSELQSQSNLVCRLLLEKKKKHRAALYNRLPKPLECDCHGAQRSGQCTACETA